MQELELFKAAITQGIPEQLPDPQPWDPNINHAPVRKQILTVREKKLALANALRYFPEAHHPELAPEFARELDTYGRIYMYRFRPTYAMHARPMQHYPARCEQAASIMLMIQNNLDAGPRQDPEDRKSVV